MHVSLIDIRTVQHVWTQKPEMVMSENKPLDPVFPSRDEIDPLSDRLQGWLSDVGLERNPFQFIDAGKDPLIPYYLVEHNQFEKVNRDQPSFVFAPAGGGKSAFRVRLARECRAGGSERRVFPIIFKPSEPGRVGESKDGIVHYQQTDLLHYASQELFLQLAYFPYVLDEMEDDLQQTLLSAISWGLDFSIEYYLNQITASGSIEPIVSAFDPTARSLPNPPGKDDIQYLKKKLENYDPALDFPKIEERLDILFDLILNRLKFEAVYILVDGVDAFLETIYSPRQALLSVSWLLENTLSWVQKHIFVKYFLPEEIRAFVIKSSNFRPLTSKSKIIIIKWDADSLREVIRQRLQEASGGKFDSLTAISDRALRASGQLPEDILISELRRHKKLSPRSLIRSLNWLLANHVRDELVRNKLSPQDLKAVREWIRNEYSAKE